MIKYLIHLLIILFVLNYISFADGSGRATRTSTISNGCGNCHGNSKSTSTSVTLLSGSLMVEPGSNNDYTIRVFSSGNVKSGINIGVKTTPTGEDNAGTLTAGNGTKSLINELVHSAPKTASNGNADFDFSWKAPLVPGKYYLRAVGAACNGDEDDGGDTWNWMDLKEVIVRGVEITEPNGGESYCVNKQMIIKWKSAGISNIKIELSTDGGNSWGYTITNSFNAIGGNYTWNIPNDFLQGKNFKLRLSDVTDETRKSVSKNNFNINGLFSITSHPSSKDICEGDNYKLIVQTQGTGLTYQWRKNGANIFNATDSVYEIKNASIGDGGYYGVVIKSPCSGDMSSNEAQIQVRKRPVVKLQPNDVITCVGGTVTFETDGDGQDIKYQWYKEAVELYNQKSYKLEIKDVQPEDAGSYYCRISGFCDPSVITDSAKLIVNQPVQLLSNPKSLKVCEKSKVEFKVETSGLQVGYKWYFNGNLLSVPSEPVLTLNNVTGNNQGDYHCVVSNPCGASIASQKATLTVDLLPKITSQSNNKQLTIGDKLELSIVATGVTKGYQWRFKKNQLPKETNPTLVIENVDFSHAGDYDCQVTNDCGTVTSVNIIVTVLKEQPGAKLAANYAEFDFGNVFNNYRKDSIFTASIRNNGDSDLVINQMIIENDESGEFIIPETLVPMTILPKTDGDIFISFQPKVEGPKNAVLKFNSNSIVSGTSINLKANSCLFSIGSEKVINFGNADYEKEPVSKLVSIINNSNYGVTLSDIVFSCTDVNPFTYISPELPKVVQSGNTEELTFEFAPKDVTSYLCGAEIKFANPDTSILINFIGYGITDVQDEKSDLKILVFPNPSDNLINIDFTGIDKSFDIIYITNAIGEVIQSFDNVKNNQINWNGKNLMGENVPNGLYLIIFENKFDKEVHKLLIFR